MTTLSKAGIHFTKVDGVLALESEDPSLSPKQRIKGAATRIKSSIRRVADARMGTISLQGSIFSHLPFDEIAPKGANCPWATKPALSSISQRDFAHKAITNELVCGANLKRWWGLNPACKLCGQYESNMHVLNGCPRRMMAYRLRHNKTMKELELDLIKLFIVPQKATMRVDRTARCRRARSGPTLSL
jgi:hypothetical protein